MIQDDSSAHLRKSFAPFVSVIIPTYNRSAILVDTVQGFLEQEYPKFEILVIDQTEHVSAEIDAFFANPHSEKIRYLHLDRPGLPNARNVGIEHSRGEFVLFVDDDVTPVDEQFITEHMNNYLCPEVVGVAGRVIEKNSAVTNPECLLRITRWGTVAGGPHGVSKTTVDTMQGCNMSFRRKEALDAGLFSNCIIGSAHFEDAEFALRLRKHTGGSLVFDPNAALFHHQSPAGGCQSRSMSPLQRQFWRFHNMTFTAFENPDVISPSLFIISRLVAMLRIAVQLRSLSALYWLTYAIYLGVQTHNRREVPAGKLDFVKRHI